MKLTQYIRSIAAGIAVGALLVLPLAAQKTPKKKKDKPFESEGRADTGNKPSPDALRTEAEAMFIDGMKYFMLEEYSKAVDNFRRTLDLMPENPTVHYKLAEAHLRLNQLPAAEAHATRALELDKQNKYYYLLTAKVYEAQARLSEAAQTYQSLLQNKAGGAEYNYDLAQIYTKMEKYDDALVCYERMEVAFGITEIVSQQKQQIYRQRGQTERALTEAHKLHKIAPENATNAQRLAEMLLSAKQPDAAQEVIETSLKYSQDATLYLVLAQVYQQRGDEIAALRALKTAFDSPDLDPDAKFKLWLGLAQLKNNAPSPPDLITLGEALIKAHPRFASIHPALAEMYQAQSQPILALQHYRKAIQLGESRADVWQRLLALEAENEYNDSLALYADKALEVFPNQAFAWMYAAASSIKAGNATTAANHLNEAKSLANAANNQEMLRYIQTYQAELWLLQKNYIEADKILQTLSDKDFAPAQAVYVQSLLQRRTRLEYALKLSELLLNRPHKSLSYALLHAQVLYQLRNYPKAQQILEQHATLAYQPAFFEVYGDVLFKMGDANKALKQWQKAREMGGTSPTLSRKIAERKWVE